MARPTREAEEDRKRIVNRVPPEYSGRSDASAAYLRRPRELQDGLNRYCYHPLAWRLARKLAPLPVTPNMVSIFGACLVVVAGLVYVQPAWPVAPLTALFLHMSWHVIDGADGDLARLTGRSSPYGEMIDGLCDYASHAILYILLGFSLQARIGAIAWLPTLAAGFSRIVQANYYEVQRRQYQWWAYGIPWLRQGKDETPRRGPGMLLARMGQAYLTLAARLSPDPRRIDRTLAMAAMEPVRLSEMRDLVRHQAGRLLPQTPLLGANWRTIMLGLSMLAGSPLYYFLYEALVLNGLLASSILRSRRQFHALEQDMDQALSAKMSR